MKHFHLFPEVLRQRTVIEFLVETEPSKETMIQFMKDFSDHVGMTRLREPEASPAGNVGWGYWQHWITSGCHVYTYAQWNGKKLPKVLITIDTYTCKAFNEEHAVDFVKRYFTVSENEISYWNA